MAPIPNSFGAASARGLGFTALTVLGPSSWALVGLRGTTSGIDVTRGMAASDGGVLCVMSGFASGSDAGKNVMRFFDDAGLSTRNTVVNSYYDGPDWGSTPKVTYLESHVNNNSLTAPIFYPVVSANYYTPYGGGAFYHTTTTPVWTSPTYNPWQFSNVGYNYGYACQNLFTDSSNNAYIVPQNPTYYAGKFTASQTMAVKLASTGAMTWAYRTAGANYVDSKWQNGNYGVIRTDGKVVVVGTGSSNYIGIYELSSTGSVNGNWAFQRQSSSSLRGSAMIDSSNNIYVGCGTGVTPIKPRLFKFTSAYAVSGTPYEYTPGGSTSSTENDPSWHYYNGKIYNFANRVDTSGYALTCIDAGTLVPDWTLNITITGFNTSNSIGSGGAGYKRAITATSKGIYLAIYGTAASGPQDISLILKVPLTGALTTSSKSIALPSGGTLGLTTAKVTSGATMTSYSAITLTTSTAPGVSLSSTTWSPNAGTTPAVFGTAAVTSLTNLP